MFKTNMCNYCKEVKTLFTDGRPELSDACTENKNMQQRQAELKKHIRLKEKKTFLSNMMERYSNCDCVPLQHHFSYIHVWVSVHFCMVPAKETLQCYNHGKSCVGNLVCLDEIDHPSVLFHLSTSTSW